MNMVYAREGAYINMNVDKLTSGLGAIPYLRGTPISDDEMNKVIRYKDDGWDIRDVQVNRRLPASWESNIYGSMQILLALEELFVQLKEQLEDAKSYGDPDLEMNTRQSLLQLKRNINNLRVQSSQ